MTSNVQPPEILPPDTVEESNRALEVEPDAATPPPEGSRKVPAALKFVRKYGVLLMLALAVALIVPAGSAYSRYYRVVTRTLHFGPFANTSNIFTAPRVLDTGAEISMSSIASGLARSGYTESRSNRKGWYILGKDSIEIHPGPDSHVGADAALVRYKKDRISEIVTLDGHRKLPQYFLEPELIANIADDDREKRRLVTYSEIPPVVVKAVISAEDKRFFDHMGFDVLRLAKAAYVDLKYGRKQQGASTITMQLARSLWLSPEKRWRRKFSEGMITLVLEQRLTKQEIFQYYANEVYLGRSNSFSIHGLGEASSVYFQKDISRVTLPEAAMLAGMIQRPAYYNPERYPDRAKQRRNTVLRLMRHNGYITTAQFEAASKAPIEIQRNQTASGDAPYFVALLNHELQDRLRNDQGRGALQVYSTLDPDLQRAATDAVRESLPRLDKLVRAKGVAKDGVLPQVALVALDPRTGAVKALVGGRDYGVSQLNHALSMRQPGSVFKPFVYAAALNTALDGSSTVFTPVSTVIDEPETFYFRNQVYQPSNFEGQFYGPVTVREAMAKSMNLATLKIAEQVGYDKIVNVARKCGLNDNIQATPAVALGAYETTPLEMAGAYTVFANRGEYVPPTFISRVSMEDVGLVLDKTAHSHPALDPRVAFLMGDLLQQVTRTGTAASVGGAGLGTPTAGKTGTSRDGWFAGFTPDLLTVVWVGFDDNRELKIEGAHSALPIWINFMKRAVRYHPPSKRFDPPPRGVVSARVDPESGLLAGDYCEGQNYFFIAGTEPVQTCQPPPTTNPFRWIGNHLWPHSDGGK